MADEWDQYVDNGSDEFEQYVVKDNKTQTALESRPSAIMDLTKTPISIKHPIGSILRTVAGAAELYQGVPSSIALDIQSGRPQDIASNVGKVLTGLRPAQYGDVFRSSGLPEGVSSAAGLYTDIALSPGGANGIQSIGKGVIGAGKGIVSIGKSGVDSAIKSGRRIIESFKGASSSDLSAQLAQRKVELANIKKSLEDLSKHRYLDIVNKVKRELPNISRNMSSIYGESLESIFKVLDDPLEGSKILKKNAPAITRQEIVDKIGSIVDRASQDPLIVKSEAYKKATSMLDYFKNGLNSEAGLVDESGRILKTMAPEAVDIRDLISKIRDVRSTINASTQSGSAPLTAKDYFATQFDSGVSNLLKERVSGFAELQSSYAPLANTKKVAYKLFKPLSDEDNATAFLTRIKNGSMKSSDMKVLRFLQSGGTISGKKFSGIGDISSDLQDIGTKLNKIKSGDEIRELGSKIATKASNESFRNRFLLWVAGTSGVGTGIAKGSQLIFKD
jgi:hypothetical protein